MIDLSQYEDAASLNRWFQSNYPMGSLRIIENQHHLFEDENGQVIDEIFVVMTGCFRDIKDEKPATTNFARGKQSEYPKHMQKFFAEDVTTSSYARSIALLKATDKTASKESMMRAKNWSIEPKADLDKELLQVNPVETLTREVENLTDLRCDGGERMLYKAGISKTTNKPFAGYVCVCGQKCPPVWGTAKSDGSFVFKESING
jgi:hypothetical protein